MVRLGWRWGWAGGAGWRGLSGGARRRGGGRWVRFGVGPGQGRRAGVMGRVRLEGVAVGRRLGRVRGSGEEERLRDLTGGS